MSSLYDRQIFHNDSSPDLNESNLNILTKAVDNIANRVEALGFTQTLVENAQAAANNAIGYASEAEKAADRAMSATPEGYEEVASLAHQVPSIQAELPSKADKSEIYHENLLDNGWFTVNQRGFTEITTGTSSPGYTVDRWTAPGWYNHVKKLDNGLEYNCTVDGEILLDQYLGFKRESDSVFTVSILLVDGRLYSGTFRNGSGNITYPTNASGQRLDGLRVQFSVNSNVLRLGWTSTTPLQIRAVKLENGSISTLANDTMPNYAEELLRCQGSIADSGDSYANKQRGRMTQLAVFSSTSKSTVNVDTTKYKYIYACLSGYNQILASAFLPRALFALFNIYHDSGGYQVRYSDSHKGTFELHDSTISGSTTTSAYPLYVYGIE